MWYGMARMEADTLRAALATCDSTKHDARTIAANEEALRLACEDQYRALDRRRKAGAWTLRLVAVAAFVVGYLAGR